MDSYHSAASPQSPPAAKRQRLDPDSPSTPRKASRTHRSYAPYTPRSSRSSSQTTTPHNRNRSPLRLPSPWPRGFRFNDAKDAVLSFGRSLAEEEGEPSEEEATVTISEKIDVKQEARGRQVGVKKETSLEVEWHVVGEDDLHSESEKIYPTSVTEHIFSRNQNVEDKKQDQPADFVLSRLKEVEMRMEKIETELANARALLREAIGSSSTPDLPNTPESTRKRKVADTDTDYERRG